MNWISNLLARSFITACILAGICYTYCSAQNVSVQHQLFTVDEGLPQNYLLGLAQDSAGFIWIGTKDGLARYDGYRFKLYRHGKDPLHTPAGNNITNLYTDYRGYLWIQYEGHSIDRFDPKTGIFQHISAEKSWDPVRSLLTSYELLVDRHDNLWLLTDDKGFYRYTISSKTFTHYSTATGIPDNEPKAIMEDHSGKIWMVTQKGFSVYDHSNQKINNIPFTLSARQTYSGRNHKLGVGELPNGKILVISLDSTVLFYDPVNNSFQTVVPHTNHPLVYDAGVGNTNLVQSHDGSHWFIRNGRIFTIKNASEEIIEIDDPGHPQTPGATALLADRSGNLWFGRNAEGLCRINLNASRFVSRKYMYPNFQTDILVNELGVRPNDLPAGFTRPEFAYMFRNITDNKNRVIWIQNYLMGFNSPMIMAYDIDAKKISTLPVRLSQHGEVGISNDANGSLWFIRINSWEPFKVEHQQKNEEQLLGISLQPGDSLFKAGKVAINPVMDKDIMWVMGSNMSIDFGAWMLASINTRSKQIRYYPLKPDNAEPASSLLMMANDPFNPKYLWIGTTGNGLIRFDKTTGDSHAFTTDDGLPNNTIYAIVADDSKYLWLSSNRGITRFDPATHAIRNFDISDGLISNEFNRWHCFKLPDGRIAFGGITGYTIFDPADIKDDAFQPRVLLSNLSINNKPLPDSSSLTGSSLNALDKLVLPYDQNFLSFDFASDEYNNPQKINYRYRLINFDNDWVYARNERFANYTKLPPGKYVLEINAANISGIWSSKIKTLSIIIIPPWWQTWWAYSIYAMIALGLLVAFFYYRVGRIRLKQEMTLQQKQTEQLKAIDEMKSRFFSNITHEFRTPLSLIISPVEKLQMLTTDQQTSQTLATIKGNANRLLQLINQLLDLSKLEAGNMQLNFSRGRIDEFVEEMVGLFLPFAEHKQIELSYHCQLSEEYLFEAEKLKTVLFNLLSNAVKFTRPGGRIAVTVTEDHERIKLIVRDTGIGIAANKLPLIFNRFFQADDSRTRLYEGTGIGLALVKELVELIKGTVTAESQQNTGTIITVAFPAEKAGDSKAPEWKKEMVKPKKIEPNKVITTSRSRKETTGSNLPLLLLVEDNEELLAFLHESFAQHFRVITANNGLSALQLAKEEIPDLVISDVMMPRMDGYELCHQLKSDIATSHIAVILLTAKSSYESRIGGLQSGADDYISKPFHFEELQTRIFNLLDRQEKLRAKYREQLQQKEPIIQPNETENAFLKNIYAIIDDMIDDSQLGASKLAEKSAMSLRTLNRKLNALIGMTAGDLIRQYRLQKSLVLLKEGLNVSEAAYLVGFETPAYFSQCFKEQYGVSPKDYFTTAR